MELSDILHQMMQQSLRAAQLTDLKIGTVTSAKPLEISINPAMGPLKQSVLYLTAAVVEKRFRFWSILIHRPMAPLDLRCPAWHAMKTAPRCRCKAAIFCSTARWRQGIRYFCCGCRAGRNTLFCPGFSKEVSKWRYCQRQIWTWLRG